MNRIALGRGLDALIPTVTAAGASAAQIVNLPLDKIVPNPSQPRTQSNPAALHQLAASIRLHGVLQPILVTMSGDHYQLIAGERRWRAAREAGLNEIPAIVSNKHGREAEVEWALIENLQREDLNPIDEAEGYMKLAQKFGYTQEEMATRVGKDRSTVSNLLRLLGLPESVREKIAAGKLTAGHARALLALPSEREQIRLAGRVVAEQLSVRRLEEIVYGRPKRVLSRAKKRSPELDAVERQLRLKLGATVHLTESGKRGRIVIDYYGNDDLNRILGVLGVG
ncbi:MAG: ParB/RepB/Spo0J family partition protein [Candidatus Zixiibacteriota bacterium]